MHARTNRDFGFIAGIARRVGVTANVSAEAKFRALGVFLTFAFTACIAGFASAPDRSIVWKPAEQPLLRVDDRPAKVWNVYQENKKTNPLLVQIGARFLLVDGRERKIFEIAPEKIAHKGAELSWNPADRPSMALETSDWLVRDVGLAYKISARLVAEGHVLDIQIPHPLDIRGIH